MALITHNGVQYEIDDELSNKDMTGWILKDRYSLERLQNKVIYNSCLSNENLDIDILPEGILGMTFIACNLDNVAIPEENNLIDCLNRRYIVDEDGNNVWL